MLKPADAERFLDGSPDVSLARPKEQYSAVYVTERGRFLALERRLKTVAKVHLEHIFDARVVGLSPESVVELLSPEVHEFTCPFHRWWGHKETVQEIKPGEFA